MANLQASHEIISDKSKNAVVSTGYIKHGSEWLDNVVNTAVSALNGKADKTYVDAELAKKANTEALATVDAKVNSKADAGVVSQLQATVNTKADASTVAALSDRVTANTTKTVDLQSQIDNLVVSGTGDSNPEVVQARTDASGVTHATLKTRIDTEVTNLKSDLNETINTTNNRIGNIIAQSGTSDTEVVDARHSNVSDITYNTLSDRLDSMENYVTPQMFGAIGDGVHDDTQAFKSAISSGNIVFIQEGKYLITDSIVVPKRTSIIGLNGRYEWDKNAGVLPDKGTLILFRPTTNKSLFVLDDSDLEVGYCPSVNIENITIFGNAKSNIAIDFTNASHSKIANVLIHGFNIGLKIEYAMLCVFDNVSIHDARNYNIHITGRMSTTCRFYNCYIGQNNSEDAIGLMIDEYSGYSLTFYSLTVESIYNGVKILDRNEITFYGIYTENTPRGDEGGYAFSIGGDGDEFGPCKVNFIGGMVQGNNAYKIPNHYALQISGINTTVSVSDVKFLIFEKVVNIIDTHAKINFKNCIEISVTKNIEDTKVENPDRISYYNCSSNTKPYTLATRTIDEYVNIKEKKWNPYQTGIYGTQCNGFYVINISGVASGNTIADIGFPVNYPVVCTLLDLSTAADFINCILTSDGKLKTIGQVDGHVYKGQMIVYPNAIILK